MRRLLSRLPFPHPQAAERATQFSAPIYYIPTYNTASCHINFHQCCSIVCSHPPFEAIRQACRHRYKRLYSRNPPDLFHLGVCGELHVGEQRGTYVG